MIEINENTAVEKAENGIYSFSFPKKEESISIIEYAERQMLTFDSLPFGRVDSLVLSQLAYMHLGDTVPPVESDMPPVRIADLYKAELFERMLDDVRDAKSNRRLLNAVCCSPRYRDIRVNYYIDNIDPVAEKQFCAMTFILPDNSFYIAYRGTDATIVGWKEDFNMFSGRLYRGIFRQSIICRQFHSGWVAEFMWAAIQKAVTWLFSELHLQAAKFRTEL